MNNENANLASKEQALTMPEALARSAATNPTGSVTYFDNTFQMNEIVETVEAYAASLSDLGVKHGDRVVLQLQNSYPFVLSALALWRIGAIVIPVSPMYGVAEVTKITQDSRPVAWITGSVTWNKIGAEVLQETPIPSVITTTIEDFAKEVPEFFMTDSAEAISGALKLTDVIESGRGKAAPQVEISPDDIATLTYTSGTTGSPKGALTSHRGLGWVGDAYLKDLKAFETEAICLALAPFAHITGLAMHFVAWLMSSSSLVLGYRFNPNYYLDLIAENKATWSTGAATAFIALIQAQRQNPRDLSSLKAFGCGGAPIPPRLIGEIKEVLGVPVSPGYGLTESTGAITTTRGDADARVDEESGVVSVGPVMGDAEISIQDDDGNILEAGEQGEVCIRGGGTTTGYWENQEATDEAIHNGWFHTGDSGFLSEDGWLYIVDRTKNMIIASGYKVWPREVEDVIYKLPAVREAAVIGVPDEYRGETVKVFYSLQPGQTMEPETVIEHCRKELAAYKVPRFAEVIDEVPKNPNGKIMHRVLRDMEIAKHKKES